MKISFSAWWMAGVIFLLSCQPPPPGHGGSRQGGPGNAEMIQPVRFRPYPSSFQENHYHLLLICEVLYDVMQFTFEQNSYNSHFLVEIIFSEENTKSSFSQVWESTLSLADYGETNRRDKFFLTTDSLIIPPGIYRVSFRYEDLQGKQTFQFEQKYQFPEQKKLFTPPPLFLDMQEDKAAISSFPFQPLASVSKLPFNNALGILTCAFFPSGNTVNFQMEITPEDRQVSLFTLDTTSAVQEQQSQFVITPPFRKWREGKYFLKILSRTSSDSIRLQFPLDLIWYNKPRSLRNYDYAIQPLKLIVSGEEYKKITSGNRESQMKQFQEFWAEKDPTPETAFNEILAEFYQRVDSVDYVYAGKNRLYGWQTDPGRILLIYGPPDEVEDLSLSPVNPYLRWTYRLPEGDRIFTFQALNGRKQYRLINEEEESLP